MKTVRVSFKFPGIRTVELRGSVNEAPSTEAAARSRCPEARPVTGDSGRVCDPVTGRIPRRGDPGPGGAQPGRTGAGCNRRRRQGAPARGWLARAHAARPPGRPGRQPPAPDSGVTSRTGPGRVSRLSLTHSERFTAPPGLGTGNNGPGRRHGPWGPAARAGLPPTAARRPVPRSPGPGPGERPPVPASLPACGSGCRRLAPAAVTQCLGVQCLCGFKPGLAMTQAEFNLCVRMALAVLGPGPVTVTGHAPGRPPGR